MEFLVDTANIDEIEFYNKIIPLSGVTSNPSIVKNEGKIDFFEHMNKIRDIIGLDKTLHIQVVGQDYESMIKDAKTIVEKVDKEVYIKVPVSTEGLKAIKYLKAHDYNVTATAIYTKFQAYLAIAAGADYLAPYYNRMLNLNIDPNEAIRKISDQITVSNSSAKILAASFKNVGQVNSAFENGAIAATMSCDIIETALSMPSISKAVDDFTADWESIYGDSSTIYSL